MANESELFSLSGYDYQFVEAPPDDLICLICTFVAREPQQLGCCGRVFCKNCWETNKRRNSDKCPQCSKRAREFSDIRSDRHIKALKVICNNSELGCEWSGTVRAAEAHDSVCDYTSIQCPNHCKIAEKDVCLLRKNLQDHLNTCPKRQHQCPHCKETGEYEQMTKAHLQVCPKIEVLCGNSKCKEMVPRGQLFQHRTNCPFGWVFCKNRSLGCRNRYLRKNLQRHLEKDCPKRAYVCPHCNEKGAYDEITSVRHTSACPKMKVICPNNSCQVSTLRCDLKKHRLECPHEYVGCKYAEIGCQARMKRKDLAAHEKSMDEHSQVVLKTISELKVKVEHFEVSHSTYQFRFKIPSFSKLKADDSRFTSKSFYTHPGGYHVKIQVFPNGCKESKGTHISVFAFLLKGENDYDLPWPFLGRLRVQLLNQLENKHHHTGYCSFDTNASLDTNSRVTGPSGQSGTGRGLQKFLPHSDLDHNPAKNCQYLKDDCLYFRVTTDIEKDWLHY